MIDILVVMGTEPATPILNWLGLTDEQLSALRATLEADIEMFDDLQIISIYNKVVRLCGDIPHAEH